MAFVRNGVFASVLVSIALVASARAQTFDQGVFLQAGDGDSRTRSATVGYVHGFRSIEVERDSHWVFYGEASLGRWFARGGDEHREFTQVGVTPVARYSFTRGGLGWFLEVGVGLNVITPVFRSGDRRFSTTFNFGDHVALGTRFGDGHANEVALRVQHYSNGGIRSPNPGEDFAQLRYTRHF